MSFSALPRSAAWHHREARTGFEVVFFKIQGGGYLMEGTTTAVEDGRMWTVDFTITVNAAWTTRHAQITGRTAAGTRHVVLEADGAGSWQVDGVAAAHLDGCLDVDLESSACTNTLPVHRTGLDIGAAADAPAAWVRAHDLTVERLEQRYQRADDKGSHQRYDYSAPGLEFRSRLTYDTSGLVLDYPGIAGRAA